MQETLQADQLVDELRQIGIQGLSRKYQQPPLSSRLLHELYEAHGDDVMVCQFLATYNNTSSKLLIQLYECCQNPDVLQALAQHPRTGHDILQALARHELLKIRESVAVTRHITPQTASLLAKDPVTHLRAILAENPELFQRIQLDLADTGESCVQVALTQHRQIAPLLFEKLRFSTDPFVKASLCALSHLGTRHLLQLADSEDHFFQTYLLEREMIPDEVLESLCFSQHHDIALKALARKKLTADELVGWAGSGDPIRQRQLAQRTDLPEAIQELLAEQSDDLLRERLASNPHLCLGASRILLGYRRLALNLLLAQFNRQELILDALCEIGENATLKLLALREDLTEKQLGLMVNYHQNMEAIYLLSQKGYRVTQLQSDLLGKLLRSQLPTLRAFAAHAQNLTLTQQHALRHDPAPQVRLYLASNLATHHAILEQLQTGPDPRIATSARETLEKQPISQKSFVGSVVPEPSASAPAPAPTPVKFLTKLIDKLKGN